MRAVGRVDERDIKNDDSIRECWRVDERGIGIGWKRWGESEIAVEIVDERGIGNN